MKPATTFKLAFIAAWTWEVAGYTSPRIPTISKTVGIHPWLGLVFLLGLAYHFYSQRIPARPWLRPDRKPPRK